MSFTERLAVIIDSAANVSGFKEASAASGDLGHQGGLAQGALQRLGIEGSSTGALLKTALVAGTAAAGLGIAKFALDGVSQFSKLTGEIRSFQRTTGATAEQASLLVNVSDRLGVASDATASGMFRLGRQIADGKSKLGEYGVEVAKNKDGTTDLAGTLENVSQKFVATQDPAARARLAFDLFGKSGATMIPILQQGKAGLAEFYAKADESHQIFNQDDINRGKAYKVAVADLGEAWKGFQIEAGQLLVPALTSLAGGLTNVVHGVDDAINAFDSLPAPVKSTATNFGELALGGAAAVKAFGLVKNIVGSIPWPSFNTGVAGMTSEVGKATGGANSLGSSIGTAALVGGALTLGLGALSYGMSENAATAKKNAQFVTDLATSLLKGGDAAKKTNEFLGQMKTVQDALASGKPIPDSIGADARLAEAAGVIGKVTDKVKELKAQQSSSEAVQQRLNTAQQGYADVVASGTATTDQLTAARQKVTVAAAQQKTVEDTVNAAVDAGSAANSRQILTLQQLFTAKMSNVNAQFAATDANRSYEKAVDDVSQKQYAAALAGGKNKAANDALRDSIQAGTESAQHAAEADVAAEVQKAKLAGTTLSAKQQNDDWIASLKISEAGLAPDSPLRKNIDGLIAQAGAVPDGKTIAFTADTADAQAQIAALIRAIQTIPKTITTNSIFDFATNGRTATGGR